MVSILWRQLKGQQVSYKEDAAKDTQECVCVCTYLWLGCQQHWEDVYHSDQKKVQNHHLPEKYPGKRQGVTGEKQSKMLKDMWWKKDGWTIPCYVQPGSVPENWGTRPWVQNLAPGSVSKKPSAACEFHISPPTHRESCRGNRHVTDHLK